MFNNPQITSTYIYRQRLFFIIPENSKLYQASPKSYLMSKDSLKLLDGEEFIRLTDDSFFQKMIDHMFSDKSVKVKTNIKVNNTLTATQMAIDGLGTTVSLFDTVKNRLLMNNEFNLDEGMIDMTDSWKLFGDDPYYVAHKIQKDIHDELGLYTTCGIGENPILAKLAMDNEAKHNKSMIAFWHYIDVPDTIWKIPRVEDIWGINTRTANHLRRIGITNMYELAHTHPSTLKKEFGIIGEQLFATSWGVDRSIIRHKYHPKTKSYGNSQVLQRDYYNQREIEIVIREIGEQVAARIRAHNLRTESINLYIGFSLSDLVILIVAEGLMFKRKSLLPMLITN